MEILDHALSHYPMFSWAIAVMGVISALGVIWRTSKEPRKGPDAPADHFAMATAAADRVERGIHDRFDRIERSLGDIQRDHSQFMNEFRVFMQTRARPRSR